MMGSFANNEEPERGSPRPHILMVPASASGHFYPFLQLLYHCARYEGVTVTVVSNDGKISELAGLRSKGEFHGIELRLQRVFGVVPLHLSDRYFPVRAALIAEKLGADFQPFAIDLIKQKDLPGAPTCVVSDMFFSFVQDLGRQLDIPWYPLYTSSPAYALAALEAPKFCREGLHPHESSRRNEVLNIPGLKFARVRDLPYEILEFPKHFMFHSECMSKASAIVFNTAEELEAPSGSLDAIRGGTQLNASAEHRQVPRVFPTGPILNFPGFSGHFSSSRETTSSSSSSLRFLDRHAQSSVLYISFGSVAHIPHESITEMAHGLEASGVPFIWVLKLRGFSASSLLPSGFEERMRGRGFIETAWAPQVQILTHPSTGGFMSHCGWNSVLESLCSGVPLITWPIAADQPLNARFVENVVKSGVSVKDFTPGDERILMPSREDVRKAVTLLMVEEKGSKLRKNAEEMKKVVAEAVAEGGSSHQALHLFLDEILLRSASNAMF